MTENKVYVVFEQKLGAYEGNPEVVWQNISVYQDRSDAYEYASTVDDRFEIQVIEKTINSSDNLTEEQKDIVEEHKEKIEEYNDVFDKYNDVFDNIDDGCCEQESVLSDLRDEFMEILTRMKQRF